MYYFIVWICILSACTVHMVLARFSNETMQVVRAGKSHAPITVLTTESMLDVPRICTERYPQGISVHCQTSSEHGPLLFYLNGKPTRIIISPPYFIAGSNADEVIAWTDYNKVQAINGTRHIFVTCAYRKDRFKVLRFTRKFVLEPEGCSSCNSSIFLNVGGPRLGNNIIADKNQYEVSVPWTIFHYTDNTWSKLIGTVYQSHAWRWAGGDLIYKIPVTAGLLYTVRLHFAEIYVDAAGMRLLSVYVNGLLIEKDLDVYAKAGKYAPLVITRNRVRPILETLKVRISPTVENAFLSGIEVHPESCSSFS